MKKKWMAVCIMSATIMTLVSFLPFRQSGGRVYASANMQTPEKTGEADSGMPEETGAINGEISKKTGEVNGEISKKTGAISGDVSQKVKATGTTVPGEDADTPEMRLMKVFPLASNEIRQVPRYIVEGNATYVLDEASIVVEETGRGSSEGADVVTFSRKVEDLPDNDLERIEKTTTHEGISCALLSVVYEVAKEDAYGIPVSYNAVCEYGGLKKYSNSYPTAWQMTVWYDFFEEESTDTVTVREEYEYIRVPAKEKTTVLEGTEGAESGVPESIRKEEEPFPEPAVEKFRIKPASDEEESGRNKISDMVVPLAVAAAGTGITLPFIIWFSIATASLFVLKEEEKYRYIGRIRLKKENDMYTAYLTKRLLARAEIPVFRIKLSGKVRRKTKAGMLQIHCPDGKRILLTAGKEVSFTVEGD